MQVVLNDGDKTVSADCEVDLYPDNILRNAPELLDYEMLFEPLEEEFY